MLDDDDAAALIDEAVQYLDQLVDIRRASTTFEVDGPVDEARDMLASALMANCLALKQFLEC